MTERTGLEILEEILDRLDLLEKKIDIVDQNVKNIINSIKSSAPLVLPTTRPVQKQSTATAVNKPAGDDKNFKNFVFQSTDAAKMKHEEPLMQKNRTEAKYIVVTGKMVANVEGKIVPLSGVNVKIFNDKDVVVKETKTNRSGHWVSHLMPGKFVALFEGSIGGKKLVPINRIFVVPEKLPNGKTELEVV